MNIALLAHEKKKELMVQFCIAYAGVLSKHNLWSASALGNLISANTGLQINKVISGINGAEDQIAARVSCDEETGILRLCDVHNVPVATNIATAEVIIMALDRGDLDWIEISRK